MKNIFLVLVYLYISYDSCYGQNIKENNPIKKDTMEYFDIENFRKNNLNENEKNIALENRGNIRQLKFETAYIEDYTFKNSPIRERKGYSKENYVLIFYCKFFYDNPIGKTKEYNKLGKLVRETDNDKNYPFSVEQLQKLIKNEYDVDLFVLPQESLFFDVKRRRDKDLNGYFYFVTLHTSLPDEGDFYPRREICIDANTGKIMYDEPSHLDLFGGNIIPKSKTKYPSKEEFMKKIKKSSVPYRTHNGKSYTEEEWKIFKEQEYQKYLANKNKKGFWDKLFE